MSTQSSRKIIIAAFLANLAIMISKFVAAGFTGSTAMLAEGLHSLADTGNQLFLFVGLWLSQRPADKLHPFGYGKENYFWAFVVAITMFVVGAVVSIWQGVVKLIHPHEVEAIGWALGVLVASVAFESIAFSMALRHAKQFLRGRPLWSYIHQSKEPATITVLLEDGAAMIGLALAAGGLLLAHFTGLMWFDGAASIAIGVLLAVVAGVLSLETKSLLVGEAVDPAQRQSILDELGKLPEVLAVPDLRTMHLGPDKVLVAARLHLIDDLTTDQIEQLLDRAEVSIKQALPLVHHCYLEVEAEK